MLRLLGAVMIFGSCAVLGLSARQALGRRIAAADAMLLALSLIESEISACRATLPEIINELSENENEAVCCVFMSLQRRMREQSGLSLGYLWRQCFRETGTEVGLGREECEILGDAANFLGRYHAEEQLAGLRQVARRLTAARDAAAMDLQNKGNLYRTCGIAMGILLVLVLI